MVGDLESNFFLFFLLHVPLLLICIFGAFQFHEKKLVLCFRVIYLDADLLEGLYKKKKTILGEKDEKRNPKNLKLKNCIGPSVQPIRKYLLNFKVIKKEK